MKAILISIQPKWCRLIASRKKTIEVRKTRPKLEPPFKCYIYCTKAKNKNEDLWSDARIEPILQDGEERWQYVEGSMHYMNGTVIGEFVCDKCIKIISEDYDESGYYGFLTKTCLSIKELFNYGKGEPLYGLHISDLKIYDKPKELGEFIKEKINCFEMPCQCCKFYHEEKDELFDCDNILTRPPQSWCYVEDYEE